MLFRVCALSVRYLDTVYFSIESRVLQNGRSKRAWVRALQGKEGKLYASWLIPLSQAISAAPAKDNLGLLNYAWHPIRQEAGFFANDTGDINHTSTANADKVMMPFHTHFVERRTGTSIGEHGDTTLHQRIDDIINRGARQGGASRIEFFEQFIDRAMPTKLLQQVQHAETRPSCLQASTVQALFQFSYAVYALGIRSYL